MLQGRELCHVVNGNIISLPLGSVRLGIENLKVETRGTSNKMAL